MQSRQDLVSLKAESGSWKLVLVLAKEALIYKYGVDKTWQTHSNSGLLLKLTMLTTVHLTIWRV